MTKIKISIKASGYKGSYDEKESAKSIVIDKDLNSFQLTENDLKHILTSIITAIKEIKAEYPDEQTNVSYHNDNRLESIMFEIEFNDKSGDSQIIKEKAFFEEVAEHSSLQSLIFDYCDVTDNGEEGTRIWVMGEYMQGTPAGTYAILALANKNKKWISKYIDFLKTNDLDNEFEQMWHIKALIEKYGWCKETCSLAIARNVSCCGQTGKEQCAAFLDEGLLDYLNSEENRKEFIDLISQEFEEWDQVELRLKDGSKKYYIVYVVNYVDHFDKVLKEEEINEMKTGLLNKLEDYNTN
ncbi:hypothetical protein KO500_16035 [Cellulophaga baltica]|uniref:hypothetical protein n=1 Tax=Cellulophaga TaxID=104264 RepID=UPI001C07493C|nr:MULTISPECIES: hypothetical protein [Cellulophaga]MBU2997952.1 hypothetical protein [Cellulophaga baltica]MDO6769353.1 hypothetical protein [Cellulophaga sp. 1_MG-2023]